MAYRVAKIFSCTVGASLLAFKEVDGGEIGKFLQAGRSKRVGQCLDPGFSGHQSVNVSYSTALPSSTTAVPNVSSVAHTADSLLVTSANLSRVSSTIQAFAQIKDCTKDLGWGETPYTVCADCGKTCDNALDQSLSYCTQQTATQILCKAECCPSECGGVPGCCPGLRKGVECFGNSGRSKCTVGNMNYYKNSLMWQVAEPFYCSVTDASKNQQLFNLMLTDNAMTASGSFTHTQGDGSAWTSSHQGGWNDPKADVDGSLATDGANIVTQVIFTCTGNPVNVLSTADNDYEWKPSSEGSIFYQSARVRCKITCFGRDPTVDPERGCRVYLCAPIV